MKAKLIENVWFGTDELPEGLTLNNEYKVIEVFSFNGHDVYYRIIDDNGNEQSWNSLLFEVTVRSSRDILKKCLQDIKDLSEEEFNKIIEEKGIKNKEYSIEKYTDDTFHIILPLSS